MISNLASVAAAVPPVPFINWQYVYCYIISLFGKKCVEDVIEIPAVDVPTVDVSTVGAIGDAALEASSGPWSWLWPFQGAATTVDAAGAASNVGFWAGMGALVPGPLKVVFAVIGSVLSFLWGAFSFLSFTVSGLLFLALLVALVALALIRVKEWTDYGTLPPRATGKSYGWSRWQDLLDAAMTADPKRWREGILSADDMLGELLTRVGYYGKNTAEQLRSIPEGAFVTLPQAWEAHRVRNFIAQKSSNFILTQREAFRVMKLYEQVFEEFDFI